MPLTTSRSGRVLCDRLSRHIEWDAVALADREGGQFTEAIAPRVDLMTAADRHQIGAA
jgi:hypothetical protein